MFFAFFKKKIKIGIQIQLLINNLLNVSFQLVNHSFFNHNEKTNLLMYSMTLLQKSQILSKFWVWEKSPNVGGRIKRVARGLEGGKKLFSTLHYIYFQEMKKKKKKKKSYMYSMSELIQKLDFRHWTSDPFFQTDRPQ